MNLDPRVALMIAQTRNKVKKPLLDLDSICFPKQLAFIRDPAPFMGADCSRRAGKTEVCAYDLLDTATRNDGVVCLYITLTRTNAEKIVWKKLKEINDKYLLGGQPNESKLSMSFPNGSIIYLSGCKDKSEVEKFRGLALKLVYIDEVQSFKSFIEELIDEVIAPALADYAGKLKFIGTPAPLQSGFFWKILNNPIYSRHHWTFWDNPFIAQKAGISHAEILQRELNRRGVDENNPSVRREWFGEWTVDTDSLVFQYSKVKNSFVQPPTLTDYVIGLDFGTDDADAIAVLGWHKNRKEVYLVEEFVKNGLSVSEIVAEVDKRMKKYNPLKVVADTGANGKKIALEISKRTGVPVYAADKARKIEHITWLNDAFRTNLFYARSDSKFADDCAVVEWDYDKSSSDKLVIKDEPHSDVCDAVLYAYVECLAWLSEPEIAKKDLKTQWAEFSKDMADRAIENQIARQKHDEIENDFYELSAAETDADVLMHYVNKRKK